MNKSINIIGSLKKNPTKSNIREEEQEVLRDTLLKLDQKIEKLRKSITDSTLSMQKARESLLDEAYGGIVTALNDKKYGSDVLNELMQVRENLYSTRLKVEIKDAASDISEIKEIKIGLHSAGGFEDIISWKAPVCRHYQQNEIIGDYEYNNTQYKLLLKRTVNIKFDEVIKALQLFPEASEGTDKIIADEFLKDLLRRRADLEFRNIVFSIQKRQWEIIQVPVSENIIVQGCAGSGKSMIMLHRLPVVLFDNPDTLRRTDIYTITPSSTYVQMVRNMLQDLEIGDIQIGTIQDYYDALIRRYNGKYSEYENAASYDKAASGYEKYIYSDKCIKRIQKSLSSKVLTMIDSSEYEEELRWFGLKKEDSGKKALAGNLEAHILNLQHIINENDKEIKRVREVYKTFLEKVRQLSAILSSRSDNIQDPKYARHLKNWAVSLNDMRAGFIPIIEDLAKTDRRSIYQCFSQKEILLNDYVEVCDEILQESDNEQKYGESIVGFIRSTTSAYKELNNLQGHLLSYRRYESLTNLRNQCINLSKTLVNTVYKEIVKHISESKDIPVSNESSRYLYLQTLFQFHGSPNYRGETLITIDETQTLEPAELRLIKAINPSAVFNFYGDVHQHIEGERGFDSWQEIKEIAVFKQFELTENYRNAARITEYCNEQFGLGMDVINDLGGEISFLKDAEGIKEIVRTYVKDGLKAIIVKSVQEAKALLAALSSVEEQVYNLTLEELYVHRSKWNLLTVQQTKGLEFRTVIAISEKMTENERYIAYTRALETLYIYDTN